MSVIKNNCIFIHIPKCAGTSMERASWGPQPQPFLGTGHQSVQDMVTTGLDDRGNEYDENLPILCFVRNPYDRLFSAFCYKFYHLRPITPPAFEEFVNELYSGEDFGAWFKTQFSFVSKDGNLAATHIYRFEDLHQDFQKMAGEFFPSYKNVSLPHENRTEVRYRRAWKSFFKNKEVKEKVDELYRIDFDTFNYPMVIQ